MQSHVDPAGTSSPTRSDDGTQPPQYTALNDTPPTLYIGLDNTPPTLLQRLPLIANFIFTGLGHGGLFILTNCAGAMALIAERSAAITVGIAAGVSGGFSNISQAPQATRQLFSFRPDIWLLTLATAPTIGGYAALPIVAGVLQSTQTLEDKTGITFSKLNPVLGNLALVTTSIVFSIGLVNQVSNLFAYLMWRCFQNNTYKYALMHKFINSQRSPEELRRVIANPDSFQELKMACANLLACFLSLLPSMFLAWSIAPEIPKAIALRNQIPVMQGMLPIESFASTDMGSKIIALSTIGLLTASFAQDGLRTMKRDFSNALTSSQKIKNLFLFTLYATYILSTSLTGALQSKESGDSNLFVIGTMLSVFVINYAGPRQNLFESRFAKRIMGTDTHFENEKILREQAASSIKLLEARELETTRQTRPRHTSMNPLNWLRRSPNENENQPQETTRLTLV